MKSRLIVTSLLLAFSLNGALNAADSSATTQPSTSTKPASEPKKIGKATSKSTAKELVEDMERSLAFIGKAAQKAKLDPKKKEQAPLFSVLKKLSPQSRELKSALASKNEKFFSLLGDVSKNIAQLDVVAPRIGLVDKDLNAGVKALKTSFGLLRNNYGKESVRRQKGGALTAQEKKQLETLKAQQKKLESQITALQAKAKGNKKLEPILKDLLKELKRIDSAPSTLEGYFLVLEVSDFAYGYWDGYSHYIPVDYRDSWNGMKDTIVVFDTVVDQSYSSITVENWSFVEQNIYYENTLNTEVNINNTEINQYESYIDSTEVTQVQSNEYIDVSEDSLVANEQQAFVDEGDIIESDPNPDSVSYDDNDRDDSDSPGPGYPDHDRDDPPQAQGPVAAPPAPHADEGHDDNDDTPAAAPEVDDGGDAGVADDDE